MRTVEAATGLCSEDGAVAPKMGKTGLTEEQLAYVEPMVTVPVGLALGVAS